jgi:2-oxoglutarate ferredoxin oxidoreductase subunit gamma
MYKTVMDKIGRPIVFNICMLGVLIGLTQLVKIHSVMKVLQSRIPPGFLDMNKQALELGLQLAKPFKK